MPQTGFEPATPGLGIPCSIHLSYWGVFLLLLLYSIAGLSTLSYKRGDYGFI